MVNNVRFALEVSCFWASQNERFCSLSLVLDSKKPSSKKAA
jgi:hypothetical protein|tara:strand:+ start:664 stop:786 length:123 start_codon:yes stop_codon:yes gene_type:complete